MSPRASYWQKRKWMTFVQNEIAKLVEMRKQLGLTQEELADELGVSQGFIARLESGKVDPKLSTILRIRWTLLKQRGKTCRDVMSKNPITINARDPVADAVRIMRRRSFSQLPVVRVGLTIGLITELDIIKNISLDMSRVTVEAIMGSTNVPRVDEETPIKAVIPLLEVYQAVLVENAGRLLGIITRSDIIKQAL